MTVCVLYSVQCDGAARSPAVFAAMVSYIRDVLDVFGINMHSKVRIEEELPDFWDFPSVAPRIRNVRLWYTQLSLTHCPAVMCRRLMRWAVVEVWKALWSSWPVLGVKFEHSHWPVRMVQLNEHFTQRECLSSKPVMPSGMTWHPWVCW